MVEDDTGEDVKKVLIAEIVGSAHKDSSSDNSEKVEEFTEDIVDEISDESDEGEESSQEIIDEVSDEVKGEEFDDEELSLPIRHLTTETAQELDETNEVESLKKIEAALFLSARYLSLQELLMLTDINPLMLKEFLVKLIEKYAQDNSSIEIVKKGGMWKMDVKEEYVGLINKLATGSAEFTKAEQETLAVIAYKQPVKQSVIIKIRGNKSYEHIKNFISLGLVNAKKVGHTQELHLSDTFFEYFHLVKKGNKMVQSIEPL